MDFLGFLFFTLSFGYLGINIWDLWEEHESRNLFNQAGRFIPRYIFRPMIAVEQQADEPPVDTRFAIQHAGAARRCEVCHQADRFDAGTGVCQRCNHRTL